MSERTCKSELATRPILYSDTLCGKQVGRDDLWAVTTEELNALHSRVEALEKERDTLAAEAVGLREALSKIVNDSSTHVVPNNGNDYADLCLACRARDDGTGRPSDLHRPNCVIREARRLLSTPSAEIERSMTQNAALETKAADAFALSECLRAAVTILASEAVGLREAALQAATLFDGMVLNGKLDQHECRNTFQRLKKALSSAPATEDWIKAFEALVKEHQERRIEQFYRPLSSEMLRHKELYNAAEQALAKVRP